MCTDYRPNVGTLEINNMLHTNYNATHVENKWKVIERSHKRFIDNQTKTERGKNYFEYKEENDAILKKKQSKSSFEVLISCYVNEIVNF